MVTPFDTFNARFKGQKPAIAKPIATTPHPAFSSTVRAIMIDGDNPDLVWIGEYAEGNYKKGLLGFPGGKVKPQEVMYPALRRELKEETGISAEHYEILPAKPVEHDHPHGKGYCFIVKLKSGAIPSDTSEMVKWQRVPLHDIANLSQLSEFCRDYLSHWFERSDSPIRAK